MPQLQDIQHSSTELVVYIPLSHRVVTIAWYASIQILFLILKVTRPTINRVRVIPTGIFRWLRARRLFWPCFCHDDNGDALPSQMVQVHQETLVVCHLFPSGCQFHSA